jgi:hypothetical protein
METERDQVASDAEFSASLTLPPKPVGSEWPHRGVGPGFELTDVVVPASDWMFVG